MNNPYKKTILAGLFNKIKYSSLPGGRYWQLRDLPRTCFQAARYYLSRCSDWVSLDYISKKLERTTAYLLSDILPYMLENGLIERMYPQTPRHPNQKYRRKDK